MVTPQGPGLAIPCGVETDELVYTMIPSLIAAGGAVAGAGVNALAQRAANDRSFRQTKQLFGMQQLDRNAQNVYNSPTNQVAMLKAAGLSPASFYGGAAQSAGSAGVAAPGSPEVGAPDLAAPFSSVAQSIGNLSMLHAQKENVQAGTEKARAEVGKLFAETAQSKFDYELNQELRQTIADQVRADLAKTQQETASLRANELLSKVDAEYRKVGIELTRSQIGLNEKQKEVFDAEMRKMGFDILESQSRVRLNAAQQNLADTTARQLCFEIEHLMPAMVADYAASAGLKTTQSWDAQENAKFQQWYNENMLSYLPDEMQSKIAKMDKETKVMAQQNVRDWIKLPAEFLRDAGIGIGAIAQPIGQLFGARPGKIGF